MNFEGHKQSTKPNREKYSSSGQGNMLPIQVSNALSTLPGIQDSLREINTRLVQYDQLKHSVDELKEDIWAKEGLDCKISYVAQQSEDNVSDIASLKRTNYQLVKEIELLKSVVINLDRKVSEQASEILDLKGRSMRDNILLHNFPENRGENLKIDIPKLMREIFDINVEFVNIHRNGPFNKTSGKPRSITGRLVNSLQKDEILSAQKQKKEQKAELPFYITPQSPVPVIEQRKKLVKVREGYTQQNVQTRIVKDKIIFNNGSVYREKIPMIRAEDILSVGQEEQAALNNIKVEMAAITEAGNQFIGYASRCNTVNSVRNMYKKIACDPEAARAHHRILVYRFRDRDGKLHEGYHDDGEHGAGRKLLECMTQNNVIDITYVITRKFTKHIGPKRFSIMEDLVRDLSIKL